MVPLPVFEHTSLHDSLHSPNWGRGGVAKDISSTVYIEHDGISRAQMITHFQISPKRIVSNHCRSTTPIMLHHDIEFA